MKVTADTITDEQIRALRGDLIAEYRNGAHDVGTDLDHAYAALKTRGGVTLGFWSGLWLSREDGRKRCAELLNLRAMRLKKECTVVMQPAGQGYEVHDNGGRFHPHTFGPGMDDQAMTEAEARIDFYCALGFAVRFEGPK